MSDFILGTTPFSFLAHIIRGRMLFTAAFLCVLALGAQSLDTLSTVALRRLVNSISIYMADAAEAPSQLIVGALLFIGCATGGAALSAIFIRVEAGVRTRVLSSIERGLFGYTLWHAPHYFERRLPGEIAQQIRNAALGASGLFNTFFYFGMRFLAMLVSAGVVFSGSIPALNLLALLWTIIYLVGSYYITRTCTDLSKQFGAQSGHVIGRMVDTLRNMGTVRSFGRQAFEQSYVGRHIDEERKAHTALRRQFFRLFVFQITCKAVLNVLVIGYSLYALFRGRIDVGSVVMLITLAGMIASLVQDTSSRMYDVSDNFGKLANALSYLTIPHAIQDARDATPLSPTDSSIRFEHVTFRYPTGGFVIKDLSFFIEPGEKVGIVGASGSGKSTILRLLKREYELRSGHIFIGNVDISRCTLSSLVDCIAEVPQHVRLFNRSIRENIAYARPNGPDAFIVLAAENANCLNFISQRPDGIDAEIGEDGGQLSGGERQRVSIARAILKDAPILLLDEATSSLDASSEAYVQQSLANLMQGKTVIAIAHRLSTLRQMDRIVVIADGRIIEEGRHADLLSSGHYYRRLWEDQGNRPLIPS